MNAAEIKLELFRIIDNLESSKLENVYSKIIGMLQSEQRNEDELPKDLLEALDAALEESDNNETVSHNDAVKQTKEKYPHLPLKGRNVM
jgi:hypothetical protein